jgi:hypothetical protein
VGPQSPRLRAEALVHLPVVGQVADPVHRVLQDGRGGENDRPDRRLDERNGVEGGNEYGELADVAIRVNLAS